MVGKKGYSLCEDTLALRLTSELVDLRSGYANPAPCGAVVLGSYSRAKGKKTDHRVMVCFLWLGNRDSNPNKQSQSLSCCRYTIPQCRLLNFVKNKQSLPLGVTLLDKQLFVLNTLCSPRMAIYRSRGMQSLSCCRYTIPQYF